MEVVEVAADLLRSTAAPLQLALQARDMRPRA